MEPFSLPLDSLSFPAFTPPLPSQVINSGLRGSLKRATFAALTPSAKGERNKQRLFCCQMCPEASESPLARLGVPWPLSSWALCLAQGEHSPEVQRWHARQRAPRTFAQHSASSQALSSSSASCPGPLPRRPLLHSIPNSPSIPGHLWSGICRYCPAKYLWGHCTSHLL